MLAEWGQVLLALAIAVAALQAFFGLAGAQRGRVAWMVTARRAALAQGAVLATAFAVLIALFL
uniref:hypothetical protein n=1 Tax=Oceanobacillus saliphilus TaxID=2925834 RepID=UPI00201DAFEE